MPNLLSRRNKKRGNRARDREVISGFVGPYRTGMRYTQPFFGGRSLAQWISSWVYICMERNATAVAMQTLRLYRRDSNTKRKTSRIDRRMRPYLNKAYPNRMTAEAVEVQEHPFIDLIHYVNPILDRNDLFWLTVAHLQIHGNAYWHIWRDDLGVPREVWPLPPQNVWPILGERGIYDEYEFRFVAEAIRFPAKDVIHFRSPSPIDVISGRGVLQSILNSAELNLRMQEWSNAVMENYAVPDLLIIPKGDISNQQVAQLNQDWQNSFGGWRNRGKPAVSPFELSVERLTQNPAELEFDESWERVLCQIAAGFKVPIQIIKQTDITFNNAKQGKGLWLSDTIDPILVKLAETINARLMPVYSDGSEFERSPWFVCFDNPVPEDADAEAERHVKYVINGIRTINEVRAELLLDDIEEGDVSLIPAGMRRITDPMPGAAAELGIMGLLSRRDQESEERPQQVAVPKLSLAELQNALEVAVNQNDLDLANLYREQIGMVFGVALPPLTAIAPSSSVHVGMVEPETAAAVPVEVLEAKPYSAIEAQLADAQVESLEASAAAVREGGTEQEVSASAGRGGGEDTDTEKSHDGETGNVGVGVFDVRKPKIPRRDGSGSAETTSPGIPGKDVGREFFGACGIEAGADAKAADSAGGNDGAPEASDRKDHDVRERIMEDRGFVAVVAAVLAEFGRLVMDRLPSILRSHGVKQAQPTLADIMERLFHEEAMTEKLELAAQPFVLAAFRAGEEIGQESLAGTNVEPAGYLPPERLLAEAQRLLDGFASRVVEVQGGQVFAALADGFAAGDNVAGFTARIAALYSADRLDRNAERIARTELLRAMNAGAQANWVESGIEKNTWLASGDSCEFCLALDGKTVKLGEAFVKGGVAVRGTDGGHYTNDRGEDVVRPPLHPHCTCTILAVLEGD